MIEVIVGAAIMFVGVILGHVVREASSTPKLSKKANKEVEEKLTKALEHIRKHHADIPQEAGDEIEELVDGANKILIGK